MKWVIVKILILLLICAPFVFSQPVLPPMNLKDEGTNQGTIFSIDCVGTGISCARSGITGTLTVSTPSESQTLDDVCVLGATTDEDIDLQGQVLIQTDKMVIVDTYTDEGINAAIDSLGAEGGEVYLPEGTYTIDGQIDIDYSNTILRGSGWGTILDASGWSTDHIIDMNGCDNVIIRDLKIIGKAGGGNSTYLIHDNGTAANFRLENLWLVDADDRAINLADEGTDYGVIRNCYIDNADEEGIIIGLGDFIVIEGNTVVNCGQDGFQIGGTYQRIANNYSAFNGHEGFYLLCGNSTIVNNEANQCNEGFEIGSSNNLISNNYSTGHVWSSFICTSSYNVFTGNVGNFSGNTYWNFYQNGGNYNVYVGNSSYSSAGLSESGFNFVNTDYNIMMGNFSRSHDTSGISLDANCNNNQVAWNNLEGEAIARIIDAGSNNTILDASTGVATLTGALTVTGTITGDVTGALTGQADTVATITGLAPDTATTQAAQPNITSLGSLTSLTMAGDIQLGETDIKLDAVLSGDATWSGIIIAGVSGVTTLAVGDLCYLNADDSRWELVDANLSDGYDKQLGICVLAAADGSATEMLIYGKIRSATLPALTVGSPVYMSETAGDITLTQPTTTDAAIRIIGFGITAEDLLFCPENSYFTHT